MIQQTLRSLTLLVVAAVSVTGCATTRPAATVSATNHDAEAHRRVIAGDRLEIVAYSQGFDSLLVVNVDERGRVTLPRVGEVEVGGLPADRVRERIQQGFGEYFVDTPVNVRHLRRVSVQGEVQEPGLFWLDETTSVRELLALAGGLLETGDARQIYLQRDGQFVSISTDVPGVLSSIPLVSGDQLFVRRRSWLSLNVPYVVSSALSVAGLIASYLAITR